MLRLDGVLDLDVTTLGVRVRREARVGAALPPVGVARHVPLDGLLEAVLVRVRVRVRVRG